MENKELIKTKRTTAILYGICAVAMIMCVILSIVKSKGIVYIIMYAIAAACWVICFALNLKEYKNIKENSETGDSEE